MDDLIERLRALSRYEHSDYSIGDEAADALEAARDDAERLAFLANEPVVEGFVGDEMDIYDYACDAAEESGLDELSEADMLAGLRRLVDAAIGRARRKEAAMIERKAVEALLSYVEMRLESDKVELPPAVDDETLSALCRAWLALDAGIPATVKAAGDDPETNDPRIYATTTRSALRDGPPLACRPVRIVPACNNV